MKIYYNFWHILKIIVNFIFSLKKFNKPIKNRKINSVNFKFFLKNLPLASDTRIELLIPKAWSRYTILVLQFVSFSIMIMKLASLVKWYNGSMVRIY